MNKKEIQYVMKLIRPAVIALYGRQKLVLEAYQMVQMKEEYIFNSFCIICNYGWFQVGNDMAHYKVQINEDKVMSLKKGEL